MSSFLNSVKLLDHRIKESKLKELPTWNLCINLLTLLHSWEKLMSSLPVLHLTWKPWSSTRCLKNFLVILQQSITDLCKSKESKEMMLNILTILMSWDLKSSSLKSTLKKSLESSNMLLKVLAQVFWVSSLCAKEFRSTEAHPTFHWFALVLWLSSLCAKDVRSIETHPTFHCSAFVIFRQLATSPPSATT